MLMLQRLAVVVVVDAHPIREAWLVVCTDHQAQPVDRTPVQFLIKVGPEEVVLQPMVHTAAEDSKVSVEEEPDMGVCRFTSKQPLMTAVEW
jgi:hypothetical protein